MSAIPDDSARRTITTLTNKLAHTGARMGRAEAHMEAVRDVIAHAMWETDEATRKGIAAVPTAEVALILRRLWDTATLGRPVPEREAVRP